MARVASRRDAALAEALKRTALDRRLSELARRGGRGSWAAQLASELLALDAPEARVAHVNEALAELERRLCEGAAWPAAALRIVVAGAVLSCAVAVLAGRTDAVLPVVVLGATGALGCVECGRRARRLAQAQRLVIDAIVDAALPTLVADGKSGSTRGRRRARARSGKA